MNKTILKVCAIAIIGLSLVACKNDVKEAKTGTTETVANINNTSKYKVNSAGSIVIWKANKLVGSHEGTINISNGVAELKGAQLVGGNFTFDLNTIACTDIPTTEESYGKLIAHLKNADFFDVEKHGTAEFEITKLDSNNISGNLTLKGIKKNVTFPVDVIIIGDEVTITSDTFTIDRTEWNITHNSGSIIDPAKLGDYLIKDDVELKIIVRAKKA